MSRSWTLDPEYAAAIAADDLHASLAPAHLPVGDVAGRRRRALVRLGLNRRTGVGEGVTTTDYRIPVTDGEIPARLYTPTNWMGGSLGLYLHGGGWFFGELDDFDGAIADLVRRSGVALLAPAYRLAPEHPYPVPLADAYAALLWAAHHGDVLGADPRRLFVMGESAGGGLAAGVALLGRDRGGPQPAAQILLAPMLDDRTVIADARIAEHATWTYDDNITAWQALLGADAAADEPASMYATPGRAADLAGLPDAFIEVSTLDVLRDEGIRHAQRLLAAGVQTELHVYPGLPHRWDRLVPDIALSRLAMAARVRAMQAV